MVLVLNMVSALKIFMVLQIILEHWYKNETYGTMTRG